MSPSRLDRYLLRLMLRPVLACLAVSLLAVLLKRILEVVTEIAQEGGQLLIWRILASMVSIYASDLLPAAFLFGMFLVVSRLCGDSEIDAMLASGVSIRRLSTPFMVTGVSLAIASVLLLGYLQPYGRYGYKAAMFDAANSGWAAEVRSGVFLDAGDGYVITADRASISGHTLKGVFVRRALPGGGEEVTTAASGVLRPLANGREIMVDLSSGAQLERTPERVRLKRFQNAQQISPIELPTDAMRARGVDARELTLTELINGLGRNRGAHPPRVIAAELYARLAECLAVPLLPLMAVPLGMAAKRGRRVSGLILGALLLLGFQHSLQFVKALAETGRFQPAPAIATVFAVWATLCLWLFASSQQRPGDTPISRLMDGLQAKIQEIRELFREREISSSSAV